MKKIKAYTLGILLAYVMVMMAACGSKDSENSSDGAMTQTTQENSTSGTTQSGGGKTGTSSVDDREESTGIVDGIMDDASEAIDEGLDDMEDKGPGVNMTSGTEE
ncbi:hypothetical protein AALB16_04025 [Lachnospiraceae bacterium 62-35]